MTSQKIFITGADGFIGSHLTEKLVRLGYNVRALAQYNSFNSYGWLDNIPNELNSEFEKVLGDIRDKNHMENLIKDCDVVFHLASLIGIPYSYNAPYSYIDTNVNGTLNILQACLNNNIDKLIHTSTSEVYGTAEFVPITEQHPLKGQSPYSASKIAADQIAYSYFASYKLPLTICRPFNTYGPRQSMRAIIPTVIVQVLRNKDEIFLGSLTPTRDLNYVDDTVNGFVASLLSENNIGETINIGSNFEINMKDVVDIIVSLSGKKIKITQEKLRMRPENSEVDRLWADNSKAKTMLDWSPQYSGLDGFREGIEKTFEWFQSPKNLEKYKDMGFIS
jgi:NAD dependent epimerase/dehydratase